MELNTIKEMKEILDAIEHGKKIEAWSDYYGKWIDGVNTPNFRDYHYRIKPEEPKKKWRPFKDLDEFIKAAGGLGTIWLKCKEDGKLLIVTAMDTRDCHLTIHVSGWYSFAELLTFFTFADGTPCGVEEL